MKEQNTSIRSSTDSDWNHRAFASGDSFRRPYEMLGFIYPVYHTIPP